MSIFQPFYTIWNWRPLSLKSWHFEASEDIMTKFKSLAFHIKRIKYWNAGGSGNPPSLIPALQNRDILLIKRPPGPNNMTASVCVSKTVLNKKLDSFLLYWVTWVQWKCFKFLGQFVNCYVHNNGSWCWKWMKNKSTVEFYKKNHW